MIWSKKYTLTLLFIILTLLQIPNYQFLVDIFASTTFSRQLINDDPTNDWDRFFNITKSNCSEIQNIPYSDISSISYSSDGRYLNLTYWLSGKFENEPTQIFRSPAYIVGLAIISDDRTPEVDYFASVWWDPLTRTWTKTIYEILGNDSRILYEEHDYKISYDNSSPSANLSAIFNIPLTIEKGHLNLSLDLRSLSDPSKYFLIFAVVDTIMQKDGNLCAVVDLVDNFGIVPFPRFDISTSERNIELRPGDDTIIQLNLNSTLITDAQLIFKPLSFGGVNVDFIRNNLTAKANGLTIFDVKITIDNNIDIKNEKRYFIPIDTTVYLPELAFDSIAEIMNIRITDLNNTLPAKQYYLELTVLPPLTLQQHLDKFVSDWIVPISGLWALLAAIGAVVIPITIKMYKGKIKKGPKKIDDSSFRS